jgi:hypothetical protein
MKKEDDETIEKCLRKFSKNDWIDVLFKNPNSECLWYWKLWKLKFQEYRRRSKPLRRRMWAKYIKVCSRMIWLIEKSEGINDQCKKDYENYGETEMADELKKTKVINMRSPWHQFTGLCKKLFIIAALASFVSNGWQYRANMKSYLLKALNALSNKIAATTTENTNAEE